MGIHEARAEAEPPAEPRQGLPPSRRRYHPRRITRIAAYAAAIEERARTLTFDVEEQIRDRHEALRHMAQARIHLLEGAALDALIAGADLAELEELMPRLRIDDVVREPPREIGR